MIRTNTTCDIYRNGSAPPSAPDIAGARGYLVAVHPKGVHKIPSDHYHSHFLDVPYTTDIRDGGTAGSAGSGDNIYVPDKDGNQYLVVSVVRLTYDGQRDVKRAFLQKQQAVLG